MRKSGFKSRIIYFQQNTAVGACEDYFYLLMQGIDKDRFEVIFACPQDKGLDSLVIRIEALGIKVYRYPLGNGNYRCVLYLRSFFQKLRPGLIHFNDPCLNGIIAARLARVPVLLMTHHTPELNRNYNIKGKFLERIAFRHCGLYTIFTSGYDKDTGLKRDKISLDRSIAIYYGLPPGRFQQKYDRKEICREFSLDEGCRIIGNIARLSYQKGQRNLIAAAPLVIERFKSVKFFFVGEGELESELKAQVQNSGLQDYFIFTGYRADIPRILSAFEILVMASLFEGLCFAVIEASAMGIPVIATSVGGLRYSVIDAKTGILIPPANPQALADTILWMLSHPKEAKDMGLSGQRYFLETFTQEQMVRKTEELYESRLRNEARNNFNPGHRNRRWPLVCPLGNY